MAIISAEAVTAAEAALIDIKDETEPGDPRRIAAMQAVNDLREAYRRQEENDPSSERSPGHGIAVSDHDGSAE